jgi:hypothetical protein
MLLNLSRLLPNSCRTAREVVVSTSDLRCDRCGILLSGPATSGSGPSSTAGARLAYHPGDLAMRDDSGLLCGSCWSELSGWLAEQRLGACSVCGTSVTRYGSLHVRKGDAPGGWQLCAHHAADLLNSLRTVQPKFDRDAFRLPLDDPSRRAEEAGEAPPDDS